jgi:hypothetical protein
MHFNHYFVCCILPCVIFLGKGGPISNHVSGLATDRNIVTSPDKAVLTKGSSKLLLPFMSFKRRGGKTIPLTGHGSPLD